MTAASPPRVTVTRLGAATLLELNRPERLNALNAELASELIAALDAADTEDGVRGVVITGSERAFSAGADLNEALDQHTVAESLRFINRLRRLTDTIECLSKPVVAAIRGYCYTGGLELAMACDRRIAGENATFSVSSARIGSVAGLGGTQRLPRLIGSAKAKDLLMTARVFDAAEATELGLIDELVATDDAVQAAVRWVDSVAEAAPLAVWMAKLAVNVGSQMDLASAVQFEGLLTALAFTTEDRKEGMSAVLEHRKPNFTGR
jgi:enoyl-CoA hydratase/carnithine racemase